MWSEGFIDGYKFYCKHYDEGSKFGIDGGRISKLSIRKDGIEVVSYERGWDKKSKAEADKAVFKKICEKFN
jgi:hypothetical protein